MSTSRDEIEERKKHHLDLAFDAQSNTIDNRFYYEPMLSGHPSLTDTWPISVGDKTMQFPLWISSMTGGAAQAGKINQLLAQTAKKFGIGMGLGSCRIILKDHTFFEDFNLRPFLGDELPLFANLGIAQIESLLENGEANLIKKMVDKLDADGLFVHVNPLQEWLQPEGDFIQYPPIQTIEKLMNEVDIPIIVKEVGQGFGKESMKALLKLPIMGIDFASNGGTNFSKLELLRNPVIADHFKFLIPIGHTAEEMVNFLNECVEEMGNERKCNFAIISGGIQSFLDGYYFIQKSKIPSIYGQGSSFLKYAQQGQEALDNFTKHQIEGLLLAKSFLKVKQ